MKKDELISYEEALDILNGLPSPTRQSICERIVDYLISRGDELTSSSTSPCDCIGDYTIVCRASNHILRGIHEGVAEARDAPNAMSIIVDE